MCAVLIVHIVRCDRRMVRLTVCAHHVTVPTVPTKAATPPEPKTPRQSRVDRTECIYCGKPYRRHTRTGTFSSCPHCGEKNPGPEMRDALTAHAARKPAAKPTRTRKAPASKTSTAPPAPPVAARPGGAPVKHKATIGTLAPKPAPKAVSPPRKAPKAPVVEPDTPTQPAPPRPPSAGRGFWDKLLYG